MGLVVETERIILRLPSVLDSETIASFYRDNAHHLSKFSPEVDSKNSDPDFWLGRIAEIHSTYRDGRSCHFFIFDKQDLFSVIGFVNFSNFIRGGFHCCTLGYGLSASFQGNGIMTEALSAAIKHVFEDLRMHRIEANYHPDNRASEKVLRKIGFVTEGIAQNYLLIKGTWQPHIRTSLTNSNWIAPPE